VRDINACAFPSNPDSEWTKWARRAFEQRDDGRLCPRYDPGIANSLRGGRLPATSLTLRMAFRRLARHRPTLLVRGALSDLVEERQAAWMRGAAPTMAYAEVPGVGHAPMLTEPASLEAISAFMARVP
jgi:pimeloyl-ACP methyl ester carboxylesterase